MKIRTTTNEDLNAISAIQESAFGQLEEAHLTLNLLADPTAAPQISLLAEKEGKPAGHILFTKVTIDGADDNITASILSPLAIVSDEQGTGIGGALIRDGLQRLKDRGTDLVFVLGQPGYYTRFGFHPAGICNLQAPYPIPPEHADAWMVQALTENVLDNVEGQIRCSDTLNKSEYWVE